jgi:hypothetical protein
MPDLFDFDEAFKDEKAVQNGISARAIKIRTKIKFFNKTKHEAVSNVLTELPESDEAIHLVSNGNFDYFNIIPRVIDLSCPASEFWFSTWTLSVTNVESILSMLDANLIGSVNALTGDYMKTRESNVYFSLLDGLKKRGQRMSNNKNHAKVRLLKCGDAHYVIEGSANFTANPRIEQFFITNHQGLYEFHKEWMDTVISKYAQI